MSRPENLGNLLHHCASKFGDRPFVTMAETGETLSFSGFERHTNRFAHGLLTHRLNHTRYVALMLENSIDYLALTYALKKCDLIEVSINRAFRGPALARMIQLTQSSVLVTSPAHLDALSEIAGQLPHLKTLVIIGDPDRFAKAFPGRAVLPLSEVIGDADHHLQSHALATDPQALLFTSGTTGVSKACILSHRYAIRTAENVIPPFRVTAQDCVYSPYPLSHIGPAYYDALPALMTGSRLVLRERFSLSAFWAEINRFDVTWFMMLGSVQQLLWSAEPSAMEKSHKVTRCWSTPAPVPKAEFDARFNLHIIPGGGYGSTDAGWVVAPQWDHPGGRILPDFDVRIVDDDDRPVKAGVAGNLQIRGREPGLMSDGYFGDPVATGAAMVNGWLRTGDIARLDDDGLFYFVCRKAERLRVKGEMVSAFEIEEGALSHPALEDAAVIGVPSPLGEEKIVMFAVRKAGEVLTPEDLQTHCAGMMAKFMVPSEILFVAHLPRTPTGKPEKGKLRDQYLAASSGSAQ